MSARPAPAVLAETSPPGWYCFSAEPQLAEWDGTVWSGVTHLATAEPVLPGPPPFSAFLRQPWFRWMAVGQALVVLPALLTGSTGNALWSWMSAVGYLAFLGGSVLLVTRFLELDRLDGMRLLTWIGIGSGVVAFALGFASEALSEAAFGWPTTLWLTGPIEEGGKLLVPVLLLIFGAPRYAVPRVGLYLVLVSAATVGVLEGVEYQARPDFPWAHLQMAVLRPSAELLHVFVAGFAAAVIWLAAWRRGRIVTGAGALAFLVAAGIHSFHDGMITFFHVDPKQFQATLARTLREAIDKGLAGAVFALAIAVPLYLLVRHGTRELTGPGGIVSSPPAWRPRIKRWGCPVSTLDPAISWWSGENVPESGTPGSPAHRTMGVPGRPAAGGESPFVAPLQTLLAPSAPPGWYPVAGNPGLQAWWTGSTWTALHRWNGSWWQPW